MRVSHQEDCLDLVVHLLVHRYHLELVLEVRDSPQPADDHLGATLFGKMHQQVVERPRLDFDAVGKLAGLLQHHLGALFQREQRTLAVVDRDPDHQLVDQLHRPADNVQVTVRDLVEGPGIEPDALRRPPDQRGPRRRRSTYGARFTRRPSFRPSRHRSGPPVSPQRRLAPPPPHAAREPPASHDPRYGSDRQRNVSTGQRLSPP